MPSLLIVIAMTICLPLALFLAFLVYIVIRYSSIVGRVFEEKPLLIPLRVTPTAEGETVTFPNGDGQALAGTYLKARTEKRVGVVIFCHEYLGDRWGVLPYADHLRDRGFDLFAFDYRNHGKSEVDPSYGSPLQWVTDHEVADVRAAVAYVGSREDADPAGVGLFGISRGGGSALCAAAKDAKVWGVITDGAFPTRGMMVGYVSRWAEIYVTNKWLWRVMPTFIFQYLCWAARIRIQKRQRCRYPDIETAVRRLSPRPWLMIHGQKDAYVSAKIARNFFAYAGEPKEFWLVPAAKHNRCREKEPVAYAEHVAEFCERHAPRRPLPAAEPVPAVPVPIEPVPVVPVPAMVSASVPEMAFELIPTLVEAESAVAI